MRHRENENEWYIRIHNEMKSKSAIAFGIFGLNGMQ